MPANALASNTLNVNPHVQISLNTFWLTHLETISLRREGGGCKVKRSFHLQLRPTYVIYIVYPTDHQRRRPSRRSPKHPWEHPDLIHSVRYIYHQISCGSLTHFVYLVLSSRASNILSLLRLLVRPGWQVAFSIPEVMLPKALRGYAPCLRWIWILLTLQL